MSLSYLQPSDVRFVGISHSAVVHPPVAEEEGPLSIDKVRRIGRKLRACRILHRKCCHLIHAKHITCHETGHKGKSR